MGYDKLTKKELEILGRVQLASLKHDRYSFLYCNKFGEKFEIHKRSMDNNIIKLLYNILLEYKLEKDKNGEYDLIQKAEFTEETKLKKWLFNRDE